MSKTVFITGASSGIGCAIGNYLTQKGHRVFGTSRNPEKIKDSLFPLIKLNVNNLESIQSAVAELMSKTDKIDVLINNAGVGITGPIEETPEEEIKHAFETNFFGPINIIKEILPYMRKQGEGYIINVTSIAGYMGLPYRGIYSASKAALEITMEAMRMEISQFGIKMSNVAPGDFATNIASGRYHSPVIKGSPYEKVYRQTLEIMNNHVDEGEDPIKVAKVIAKILNSPNPKVHYRIGAPIQKLSVFLKKILPGKTYENLLLKHYKLK